MRTDILEFIEFYQTPLGALARDYINQRIGEAWGSAKGLTIAGFGHGEPFLNSFDDANRVIALAPAGQGVVCWAPNEGNVACLVGENQWPLRDASVDRLLVVHGLEETPDPARLMREIWRVLSDDGRVMFIVAHRRGMWSMIDTTPFAAGRPYLKRRLNLLLQGAMFRAVRWSSALYFPPFERKFLFRAARAWERAGASVWSGLGGVLLVEAQKDMLTPVGAIRQSARTTMRPVIAPANATRMEDDAAICETKKPQ